MYYQTGSDPLKFVSNSTTVDFLKSYQINFETSGLDFKIITSLTIK